jgi:hypothetical protein
MNPQDLIGPPSPLGYPAPFWFIEFFKVLGFVLHAIPMNLWYAGILLSLLFFWRGGQNSKRTATRLMKQMPIIVAAGVNFGIVPLLFTQVAYHQVFYPATILMAWPWFSVVILLTFAYYGIYCYVAALKKTEGPVPFSRQIVGWLSALCFIVIGFLFASGFSLMANLDAWPGLWERTSVGGAALGIGLNIGDPTFWPRWLLMFGLALMTTGVYMVVDAGVFGAKEGEDYQRATVWTALKVHTVGMVWFAAAGTWYVFGTWPVEVRDLMFDPPLVILTVLTATCPGLPWLMILSQRAGVTGKSALLTGLAQIVVLGLNAVSRQIVQNAEIGKFLDVSAGKVATHWSPMILFLLLFVAGLGVVVWMIRKVVEESREAAA